MLPARYDDDDDDVTQTDVCFCFFVALLLLGEYLYSPSVGM